MSFQLTPQDSGYPSLLRSIHQPPERLWGEGDPAFLTEGVCIGIVGARECTAYGLEVARRLAQELTDAGVVVVSGLAPGIDTAAHQGALEGDGGRGKTIAVLGCGLDFPYPVENLGLKKKIAGQGTVISEYPPGTGTARWTFPQRNRIISGLSRGVVVVEAGLKSGSLITANFALEQGREVFAVPGPIGSPKSEGTHRLIQNGAKLVMSARDILDELEYPISPPPPPLNLRGGQGGDKEQPEGDEGKILALLSGESRHMDDLVDSTGYSIEKMSALLMEMEIGGRIQALPGSRFARLK